MSAVTDQSKILPCPFCGTKRTEPKEGTRMYYQATVSVSGGGKPNAACSVGCTGCGAHGPVACPEHKYSRRPFGEEALAEWNAEAERAESRAIELWNGAKR